MWEWVEANLTPESKQATRWAIDEQRSVEIRRSWGRRLWEAGLAGPGLAREHGGMGLSFEQLIAYSEVMALSGAPESLNGNAIGIFAPTLIRFGTAEQVQRYLPPMLRHDEVWCQGFSEPSAGSDLASLRTRAERTEGGFLIRGQKIWTSRAQFADRCYILVRTSDGGDRHEGISMMVMDMHQPAIEVRPIKNIIGGREFTEVFIDGAFIPDEAVVGEVGNGWAMARFALSNERGPRMVERSLRMGQEFDKLVNLVSTPAEDIEDPSQQARLVDLALRVRAVTATVRRVLADLGSGVAQKAPLGPIVKLTWSETHQDMLALALDHAEAAGVVRRPGDGEGEDWLTAYLYSRCETIYAGSSEIQRNVIARTIGLPSSSGRGKGEGR
jgi:alkylation response protein AidB-like acyl-CoA dehydrogenase